MRAIMVSCLLASEQRNLVGAAGFEPATWSTQNSRATRLRYAPSWPRYTLRFGPASRAAFAPDCRSTCRAGNHRRATLARAKDRMCHAVAGRDAKLLRRAGVHFEHRAHGATGRNERFGQRHGGLCDAQDSPIPANEDYVEGDIGVFHPEASRLFLVEVEQHTLAFWEFAPVHESLGLLRGRGRQLYREHMHAPLTGDLERLQFGSRKAPRCPDEGQADDK